MHSPVEDMVGDTAGYTLEAPRGGCSGRNTHAGWEVDHRELLVDAAVGGQPHGL